jgi:hypothetical protein
MPEHSRLVLIFLQRLLPSNWAIVPIMHLTDFVINTGIKQNTFGGGGLSCINVRRYADVAITFDWSFASHSYLPLMLRWLASPPLCGNASQQICELVAHGGRRY